MQCPFCGVEISPEDVFCSKCGERLSLPIEEIDAANNAEDNTLDTGTDCDLPDINDATVATEQKKPKRTRKILIGGIIALAILVVGAVIAMNAAGKNYSANFEQTCFLMESSGLLADGELLLYTQVWGNAIFEIKDSKTDKYTRADNGKGDFVNPVLATLLFIISNDYLTSKAVILSDQELIATHMEELSEPPLRYNDAYMELQEFYNEYLSITDLFLNLETTDFSGFLDKVEETQTSFLAGCDRMDVYLK